MKIKKGEQVRIKRTNQVVTIADVELIRKKGQVHKYCQLKTEEGQPDLWMDSSELGGVVEVCNVRFETNEGVKLNMEIKLDHRDMNFLEIHIHDTRVKDMKQDGIQNYLIGAMLKDWNIRKV